MWNKIRAKLHEWFDIQDHAPEQAAAAKALYRELQQVRIKAVV